MTFNPRSSLPSPGGSAEEIDRLLGAYFQKEMPHPWPKASLTGPTVQLANAESRWSSSRSRMALAASVALLVAGAMLLGGSFKNPPKPTGLSGALESAKHETLGGLKSEVYIELSADGPTTINVTIDELPVPR